MIRKIIWIVVGVALISGCETVQSDLDSQCDKSLTETGIDNRRTKEIKLQKINEAINHFINLNKVNELSQKNRINVKINLVNFNTDTIESEELKNFIINKINRSGKFIVNEPKSSDRNGYYLLLINLNGNQSCEKNSNHIEIKLKELINNHG